MNKRETDESWKRGRGVPLDATLDVTLSADQGSPWLIAEVGRLPMGPLAFYGAGLHLHAERLFSYLAGGEVIDPEARFDELAPGYQLQDSEIE